MADDLKYQSLHIPKLPWRRLVTIFFFIVPVYLPAQIYKWVDENGNTHFGDKPESDTATEVEVKSSQKIDEELSERRQRQQRLLDVLDEERLEKKAAQAANKEEETKRKLNCAKAKKLLQDMNNASFLYKDTDDPQNPVILNSEERKKETVKAAAQVKRWCK